ncbi:MAG: hypothetical protein V8R30_01535 [Clostridia bacterium]|jgi:hypothetical protein
MYTTDPKIQEATVTVQTRLANEYKHRRKVIITIPASFDFDDRNSTSAYYCAWNTGKNLPECNPYCAAIEAVKSSQNNIRLHELMLTSCKEKTFVSVIGETSDNINRIMQNLTQIFGDGIDFDTL